MPPSKISDFRCRQVMPGVVPSDGGAHSASDPGPRPVDVVIAIDVSGSTARASGADVDGDEVKGVNTRLADFQPGAHPKELVSSDPGDTILAVQLHGVCSLLNHFPTPGVRVALITYAGDVDAKSGRMQRPDQANAWLLEPLAKDASSLSTTLNEIALRGSDGATDFAAAIDLATDLLTAPSARADSPQERAKLLLFLTDGVPTLPVGKGSRVDRGDLEAAMRAASRARDEGVRIHSFGIGPRALRYPKSTRRIAEISGGVYTPVKRTERLGAQLASRVRAARELEAEGAPASPRQARSVAPAVGESDGPADLCTRLAPGVHSTPRLAAGRPVDVLVAVDTSGSTADPSGVDVNGDGLVGVDRAGLAALVGDASSSSDAADTVLAAELAAVCSLLRGLPPNARLGLIRFSGEVVNDGEHRFITNAAEVVTPLSLAEPTWLEGIARVANRRPRGATHYAAAIDLALEQFAAEPVTGASGTPDSEKVLLFLSDGRPTLPFGPHETDRNIEISLEAAGRAREAGVRIHTFGVGKEVLHDAETLREIARITGGSYTPLTSYEVLRSALPRALARGPTDPGVPISRRHRE